MLVQPTNHCYSRFNLQACILFFVLGTKVFLEKFPPLPNIFLLNVCFMVDLSSHFLSPNLQQPRRGCFEIREEGGEMFISLLDMKRPFKPMKELDMEKAHNDWLLPRQMLVGGIAVANKNDIDQHAVDTVCALNPNSGVSSRYFLYKKVLECLMFVC
ncbi:hypothetical protein J1N35_010934 [Gossypium stocksii]|uniref:Uncharacterized protein n=1 Tax=Gossypium stocksii TaxID=47602 RepID=A0A9D3W108_9ROSI|nr:hypothetical protein J1N35_010934 [Gossypium stocksii]